MLATRIISSAGKDYNEEVLADNPLVYYRLDETSGTTASDAIGSNDGTYTGSVSLGADALITGGGKAADFSGGYVSIPALGSALTEWSVEAWAKFDVNTGSKTVISNDLSGWNDDVSIGLDPEEVYTSDRRIAVVHQDSVNQVRTIATDTVDASAGAIYHIVVTSDGSALRLYVNGQLQATTAKAGAALKFGNNAINIGRNPPNGRSMDGVVDEPAVYGYALSAAQVAAHYNAGIGA